jgi:DNA-binding NarL/FixJ family response regulator
MRNGFGKNGFGLNESGLVLVVDDDSGCRACMSELLKSAGYRTLTAETGEEALLLARSERPALVVLDVHMPGLSGYEVCHQLKNELGKRMMVALVSGERREALDRVAGLLIGADDYITKPFAPDEFLARVRRLLVRAAAATPLVESELTRRELEVLRLLAKGFAPAEIADALIITPKTVSAHVQNVMGKLRVHSRAQAIAKAFRVGLVPVVAAVAHLAEESAELLEAAPTLALL